MEHYFSLYDPSPFFHFQNPYFNYLSASASKALRPATYLFHPARFTTDELAKLRYGVLHLDQECWKWWQWRNNVCQGYVAWTQFVAEIYEQFDSDTHHLGHLTKLKQSSIVEDFIVSFERLDFHMKGMYDAFFLQCFRSGLKDDIHSHIPMAHTRVWWKGGVNQYEHFYHF
jgi:hypothetical protein